MNNFWHSILHFSFSISSSSANMYTSYTKRDNTDYFVLKSVLDNFFANKPEKNSYAKRLNTEGNFLNRCRL